MTVVRVTNWSTIVRWYIDILGLAPVVLDAEHEFAFLAAGGGRLGLKGIKAARGADERDQDPPRVPGARPGFPAPEADRKMGSWSASVIDNHDEGYREVRLHDPDGNSLTLFAWIDSTAKSRLAADRR